jgi:hypothetical protein
MFIWETYVSNGYYRLFVPLGHTNGLDWVKKRSVKYGLADDEEGFVATTWPPTSQVAVNNA